MGRRVAADELGQDGELAAGDLDVGRLRADAQALGDPRQRVRVGLLDRYVVEQRDRLCADAAEIVHVHRDAVDPDRVETPELLGDDHLGPDAVRRERETGHVVEPQHVRVVAGAQDRARRSAEVDRPQDGHECLHGRVGLRRVDSGLGVCAITHEGHSTS